ncbi:hypothetical protein QBC35DRAFT_485053 [Podospora australis]|uniref:Peptidase M20 dimerisation domain-containing protein n=1 Tax=Podospora australis TaxID=1536484 RepID=A0AAN6X3U9_9PEZI|nr:hypothetical protein QBC35DRAFT_485053 [Podospora australis]
MRLPSQFLLLTTFLCSCTSAHPTPNNDDAPAYRNDLLTLHRDLINIPSISGSEGDAALFLQKYLRKHHFTVQLQKIPSSSSSSSKRYNVLAWPPSSSSSNHTPRLLITSHIDVVPPYIPYSINTTSSLSKDTLISGRGSVDAKASVAAQLTALSQLPPSDQIMLLFVVGEETSGVGMKHFSSLQKYQFESAIFGEPTENKLACGHKGITNGIISSRGKAGHSGYPHLGKSATEVLIRALSKIIDTDLGTSERYGNTTVNIGVLQGGVASNVIPKEASARLAIRVAAGNQTTGAKAVQEKIFQILQDVDEEALSAEFTQGYGPVKTECDVEGFEKMVASYGTDVPNLEGDHKSYLYGPGSILVAHGDDEALKLGDLEEAVEGYKRLIEHALRPSKGEEHHRGDL